jgi:MFS family permease
MGRDIRWHDYITINIYWFALTARAQVLGPLIIPLLVQQLVGEETKGTGVGVMRLWALMVAVLAQALMGLLSDHSALRWGRRRPFIVLGTIGEIVVLVLIGLGAGWTGMSGYWALFVLYILSMVASNTAQAGAQSLMPDLVPQNLRGKFSAVKVLLELPLPLLFVSLYASKLISAGDLWGALLSVIVVLLSCTIVTLFVPEQRLEQAPFVLDWRPFLRLVLMAGVFTGIVLGIGALVRAAVNTLEQISLATPQSPVLIITTLVGLAGLCTAIVLGVGVSVRIGIGQEARRNASFVWWVMNRLAFLVAANSLGGFMLYYLQERFADLSGVRAAAPAATASMLVGICILIVAVLSGWLSDRLGRKPLVTASGVLAALGMLIVLVWPKIAAIYVGGSLIGIAIGLYYPASWALGTDTIPPDQAGRYLGLANLAGAGAGAVGAYIGGPIADKTSYTLLFVIYGTLFLLSVLTVRGIQEKSVQRTEGAGARASSPL